MVESPSKNVTVLPKNNSSNKSSSHSAPSQIDQLTGFRGYLALTVLCCHSGFEGLTIHLVGRNCSSSVTFFYVLSGFVMSFAYAKCSLESWSCRKSYILRRLARILPNYYLGLAYDADEAYAIATYDPGRGAVEVLLTLLLLRPWFVIAAPFSEFMRRPWLQWPTPTWNGPLASVGVELCFYLLFPFVGKPLLRLFARTASNKKHSIMVLVALLAYAMLPSLLVISVPNGEFDWQGILPSVIPPKKPLGYNGTYYRDNVTVFDYAAYNVLYWFPPIRTSDFVWGIYAYHLFETRKWKDVQIPGWLVDALLVLITVLLKLTIEINSGVKYMMAMSPSGPLCALFLILLSLDRSDSLIIRFFKRDICVNAGRISFAVYCIHTIVHHNAQPSSFFYETMAIVGIGTVVHFYFEQPIYDFFIKQSKNWHGWKCDCGNTATAAAKHGSSKSSSSTFSPQTTSAASFASAGDSEAHLLHKSFHNKPP